MPDVELVRRIAEGAGNAGKEEKKRPRLVKMRLEREGDAGAGGTAGAILILGDYAKTVGPWGNVGVVSGAARAGIGPLLIETLEHVAKANLLGRLEAETGKLEIQFAAARREARRGSGIYFFLIYKDVLDGDQRRRSMLRQMRRVHHRQTFDCGET